VIAMAAVIVHMSGAVFVRAQEPAAATADASGLIPPEELDSLVAPIALYPDPLLAQVLEPLGIREAPGSSLTCLPRQSQLGAVHLRLESLHAQPAAVTDPARP